MNEAKSLNTRTVTCTSCVDIAKLKLHPAAEYFPPMPEVQFDGLLEDIRTNGLREPIVIDCSKQVLDGRHRLRAYSFLEKNEIPVRYFKGSEQEIVSFVLSQNLHRRHLDESARSMLAARVQASAPIGAAMTDKEIAALFSIGERSVERAKKIVREGTPELQTAVGNGEVSVGAGAELVTLPPEEQQAVVASGPVAAKTEASNIRKNRASKETKTTKTPKPMDFDKQVAKLIEEYRRLPEAFQQKFIVALDSEKKNLTEG